VVSSTPRLHFTPREKTRYHFSGDWVGPRAGLEGGISRPHRDSIPVRPARSSVAIPTELPGPQYQCSEFENTREDVVKYCFAAPVANHNQSSGYPFSGPKVERETGLLPTCAIRSVWSNKPMVIPQTVPCDIFPRRSAAVQSTAGDLCQFPR